MVSGQKLTKRGCDKTVKAPFLKKMQPIDCVNEKSVFLRDYNNL